MEQNKKDICETSFQTLCDTEVDFWKRNLEYKTCALLSFLKINEETTTNTLYSDFKKFKKEIFNEAYNHVFQGKIIYGVPTHQEEVLDASVLLRDIVKFIPYIRDLNYAYYCNGKETCETSYHEDTTLSQSCSALEVKTLILEVYNRIRAC